MLNQENKENHISDKQKKMAESYLKVYQVIGKNQKELVSLLCESIDSCYLPYESNSRIYHTKNSTLIVPRDPLEGIDSKNSLIRVLTEESNDKKLIAYLKEITQAEVQEKW